MNRSDSPLRSSDPQTALEVVSAYIAALMASDTARMSALRGPDFVLDWVHDDAVEDSELSVEDTENFWIAWFSGFPGMDYEVTRTIAADSVVLNVTFYLCLAFVTNFWVILIVAVISGVGAALLAPAVSAMYLDVTAEAHRSRVVGIRESVLSLGSVSGPLLVIVASAYWTPQLIFMVAGFFVLLGALLAMIWLREPETFAEKGNDLASLVLEKRALAAHAALQELVIKGSAVRESRLN